MQGSELPRLLCQQRLLAPDLPAQCFDIKGFFGHKCGTGVVLNCLRVRWQHLLTRSQGELQTEFEFEGIQNPP